MGDKTRAQWQYLLSAESFNMVIQARYLEGFAKLVFRGMIQSSQISAPTPCYSQMMFISFIGNKTDICSKPFIAVPLAAGQLYSSHLLLPGPCPGLCGLRYSGWGHGSIPVTEGHWQSPNLGASSGAASLSKNSGGSSSRHYLLGNIES